MTKEQYLIARETKERFHTKLIITGMIVCVTFFGALYAGKVDKDNDKETIFTGFHSTVQKINRGQF